MSFKIYNLGNMNVCNECGEVSTWLDPDCGWCRDCNRACREWYENLDDRCKWSDEDLEEMEEW